MQGMLEGDLRMLPVLVMCVYQHICRHEDDRHEDDRHEDDPADSEVYTQQCLGRAAELLADLADLVQTSERQNAIENRRVAQETAPQLIVHLSIFALGAGMHFSQLRPAIGWCAAYFFLVRSYEMAQAFGRVLLPPQQFSDGLDRMKWTLALVFFCLDKPLSGQSTRLFSGFATGVLLYRSLFLRESHATKVIHCTAAALDVAFPSVATYIFLALRLLHVSNN